MTVVQLKALLKEKGLPVSGKKAELIERLNSTAKDANIDKPKSKSKVAKKKCKSKDEECLCTRKKSELVKLAVEKLGLEEKQANKFTVKKLCGFINNNEDIILNKGAGGKNTNYYGKDFEKRTNNEERLLNSGYEKINATRSGYYISKTLKDKKIVFVLQNGLKKYVKSKYNIQLFRCPDEAYIIEYDTGRKVILIIEKKEQNVEGSVETKLWSGPALKREYELVLGSDFEVIYCFCVNNFLKKKLISQEKKFLTLNVILEENNITSLFGEDDDYFQKLDELINSFL